MQPVVIQDSIAIAANSVNENVIVSNNSLRALQRLPFPARLTFAAVQSAAGLQFDFNCGAENLVSSSNGRVTTSTPQIPLDVVTSEGYGSEGDMLIVRAANTTGGAITLRYMIIAEALGEPGQMVDLPPNTRVMQQGPTVVTNGTVDQQLLDGLRYERPRVDSILDVFMTQSAAGITREIYIDMERIAPASTISLENRIPQDPFDTTVGGIEAPEDKQIQLQVTNQSGGNLNVFWKTKLTELVRG